MTAKKKYQVFISSTYEDLIDERACVTQTLLDLNCIPVGMEQFPASDLSQMAYIEKVLEDCDYYILISAGRYGSTGEDGISYTEKEYDYALTHGIPVMCFLIKNIDEIPRGKCENTEEGMKKLVTFREKVAKNKLVKYYESSTELGKNVAIALQHCIDSFPACGWIRGEKEDAASDFKAQIDKYLRERTITQEDIDAMLADKTIILDGGNAES